MRKLLLWLGAYVAALNAYQWTAIDIARENLRYQPTRCLIDRVCLYYLGFHSLDMNHCPSPDSRYTKWSLYAPANPQQWLTTTHFTYSALQKRSEKSPMAYPDGVLRQEALDQIDKDIPRTRLAYFQQATLYPEALKPASIDLVTQDDEVAALEDAFQQHLSEMLQTMVYAPSAMTRPSCMYVQGMNYIAASLLLSMDMNKDRALRAYATLMNDYGFYDLVDRQMDGLKVKFRVLEHLIQQRLPKLHEHFRKRDIFPEHYAVGWFTTLFQNQVNVFPETRIRILDAFFQHGWRMIYATALTVLRLAERDVIGQDLDSIGTMRMTDLSRYQHHRDLLDVRGVLKELANFPSQSKLADLESFYAEKLANALEADHDQEGNH